MKSSTLLRALKRLAGCVTGKSSTGMQRASALMLTERQELKAMVALDAQRRNQMILAQVHKERMIAEKVSETMSMSLHSCAEYFRICSPKSDADIS